MWLWKNNAALGRVAGAQGFAIVFGRRFSTGHVLGALMIWSEVWL